MITGEQLHCKALAELISGGMEQVNLVGYEQSMGVITAINDAGNPIPQPIVINGKGDSIESATDDFLNKLAAYDLDNKTKIYWRVMPEHLTDKNFCTDQVVHQIHARFSVE